MPELPHDVRQTIGAIVAQYRDHYAETVDIWVTQVLAAFTKNSAFNLLIHSTKSRVKDPERLRAKLERKYLAAAEAGVSFDVSSERLFDHVTDLAGWRIIHLHTRQFAEIDATIRAILDAQAIEIIEGPTAKVWDEEMATYFGGLTPPVLVEKNDRLYTSVHYVVRGTQKVPLTGEIQVRTLAEELWGEVDHAINYPTKSPSDVCQEQIRVLARFTTGCSRMVDAIIQAHLEAIARQT